MAERESTTTEVTPTNQEEETEVRELYAKGIFMKTVEVEAKLDKGNIQDAEAVVRERLSVDAQEARVLLGQLEYLRGNFEGALRVFEDSELNVSQQTAAVVLLALYVKTKALQKLGRLTEAASECKGILDSVESTFPNGIHDELGDSKLQETVCQAVELLPELWKQAGVLDEAVTAYRRALLSQWNLDNDCCSRIQKKFAMFLFYSGVEAAPPSLSVEIEGAYIPKNNLEEGILLLMIVLRRSNLGKAKLDPSAVEHLAFALTICSQTSVLAKQLEEVMPGSLSRVDRWNTLALCFSTAGEHKNALNLFRKSLHKHESPDDIVTLLLAASICSMDPYLAAEGASYAERAISNAQGANEHLKGVGLRMMGLCLERQARLSSSDFERSHLQSQALKSLEEAIVLERNNPELLFDLGAHYAEQRNLNAAIHYAKQYIEATGGSVVRGWRLLALILSAKQRFSEAQVVIDAALDETVKWEQKPLLKMKAKLKIFQSSPMDAIETYKYLLAMVEAQRKSSGPLRTIRQDDDDRVNEFEIWHGLATLYSSLSHWKDVEVCLEKAQGLKQYSAESLQTEGLMYEGRGHVKAAAVAYMNAILIEPDNVHCKILLGALLSRISSKALPVARGLLSDALRVEPTNRKAWFRLGMVHRDEGRIADAAECFQAAAMLEGSDPIQSFSSIT